MALSGRTQQQSTKRNKTPVPFLSSMVPLETVGLQILILPAVDFVSATIHSRTSIKILRGVRMGKIFQKAQQEQAKGFYQEILDKLEGLPADTPDWRETLEGSAGKVQTGFCIHAVGE